MHENILQEKKSDKLKGSQSSLPSYKEATSGAIKINKENMTKKKIIPVQSDFSSSPSPEFPSSPVASPPVYQKNRFRQSQSTINLASMEEGEVRIEEMTQMLTGINYWLQDKLGYLIAYKSFCLKCAKPLKCKIMLKNIFSQKNKHFQNLYV